MRTLHTDEPTIYRFFFRTLIKHTDPEWAHHAVIDALRLAQALPGGCAILRAVFHRRGAADAPTRRTVLGREHESPVGLAAGFDKDGQAVRALIALGFGHVEVGTVTPRPQPGNPRPRSFRLLDDHALVNRMGFNNAGAVAMARRLARLRRSAAGRRAVVGVNIGKNRTTELADAADDYRDCARLLAPYADYLAVNVSSPNTPGLRDLQSVDALRPLLEAVQEEAQACRARTGCEVPVLVKIAPDLHDDDVRAVAHLVRELGLAGVIATNTTVERPASLRSPRGQIEQIGAGGLSGPVLCDRALHVLHLLREELPRDVVVISAGGVTTSADVTERLAAGADLVQGFTGLIYEGPGWPGRIARELARTA